jgi:hypothetical protein
VERDSDRDRDEAAALPEHEQDDYRQAEVGRQPEPDPAEEAGLPEHEQDTDRVQDTATYDTNP